MFAQIIEHAGTMSLEVEGKFVVRRGIRWIMAALRTVLYVMNLSQRLHIMHACGSETFKHSSLTQEPYMS